MQVSSVLNGLLHARPAARVAAFVAIIAMSILAETVVRRRRNRPSDTVDTANSMAIGAGFLTIKMIGAHVLLLPAYSWVYQHVRLLHLSPSHPSTWLLAWACADFVAYWVHRAEHRVRLLWCSHLVHHSSQQFTMATAVRMPWTEALYKPLIAFWVPLLGIPLGVHGVIGGLILLTGQLQHTELIGRLPRLDRVINTPSNHRVHHASNSVYLDRNFGATTVIWDRMFGTYQAELADHAPVYGITKAVRARNPLTLSALGFTDLAADLRRPASARARLALALGRP